MMILLLALAAAEPSDGPVLPRAAASASVVATAPPRPRTETLTVEAAERFRLRDLPPAPASGPKRLNPILRLTF